MSKQRRSRSEWVGIIWRWKRSGLTAEAFAKREGSQFAAATLRWWTSRLGLGAARSTGDLQFVEVAPHAAPARAPDMDAETRLEIVLSTGCCIRLPRGAGAEMVAAILQTLEVR